MQTALKHAIYMAFQNDVAADLLSMLEQSATPSAAMSRWRLIFEAAACLRLRERFQGFFPVLAGSSGPSSPSSAPAVSFHVLLDSSPQGGRHWLLCELRVLGHRVSPDEMLLRFWKLCEICDEVKSKGVSGRAGEEDSDELLEELREVELREAYDALQTSMEVMALPPSGLGHQRANLRHKLHAFVHSLWTGTGKALPEVASAISSFTTDFGTEAGISRVSVPSEIVCPQLCDVSDPSAFQSSDDLGNASDPWPQIDFTAALHVPGVHHIMHNICQDVCEQLPSFQKFKAHLQSLSVFLCDPHVRKGMQERCFGDGQGLAYRALFDSFSERLIDWRWQSLSDFLAAMEPLEAPLRQCWSIQAFNRNLGRSNSRHVATECEPEAARKLRDGEMLEWEEGDDEAVAEVQHSESQIPGPLALPADPSSRAQQQDEAGVARGRVRAQRFDVAVRDSSVWQYMSMLRTLLAVSDELLQWFQSCPCHASNSKADCTRPLSGFRCIMKGRRAPELASGFLDEFMRAKLNDAASLFSLHSSLFTDYVAGLRRFSFMLQLKFAMWGCLPYSLLALAHHDERTARSAARRVLAEWESMPNDDKERAHAVCKSFLSDGSPVRSSLLSFVQGAARDQACCLPLRQHVARFAFLPLLERSIEGRRAVVKRATERAPNQVVPTSRVFFECLLCCKKQNRCLRCCFSLQRTSAKYGCLSLCWNISVFFNRLL